MATLNAASLLNFSREAPELSARHALSPRSTGSPLRIVRDGATGWSGIQEERAWRERPDAPINPSGARIAVCRWTDPSSEVRERNCQVDADHYVIEIAIRPADLKLWVAGRCVHDGRVATGTVQVTGPGQLARAEFRSAYDALHLFVPKAMLDDLSNECRETGLSERIAQLGDRPVTDPTVKRLCLSLLEAAHLESAVADLYTEGLALAILASMASTQVGGQTPKRHSRQGLVKWRLKRVIDYAESNLDEPLGLADLARSAGLSRMHFAAQFRAATGMQPHEYVVQKRIERAQEMLRDSAVPLVEIALSVGFQTQSHFTTVFRRLVDETPGRWRQLHRGAPREQLA